MGTEYTSKKSAHALSELKNVKNPTVMGTKYAWKNVKVDRVNLPQLGQELQLHPTFRKRSDSESCDWCVS